MDDSIIAAILKKRYDNPLEGRIQASGDIQQVSKESIDHVGKIEVSESQVKKSRQPSSYLYLNSLLRLNDCCPVALTPTLIKCCEILQWLAKVFTPLELFQNFVLF